MQRIKEKHTTCAPITMEYGIVVACCVLERLNMLLTGVIVLIMTPFVVRYFQ